MSSQPSFKTVYYPNQRFDLGILQIWKRTFRNIISSRFLIFQLFRRDFTSQYKKSFIGAGWTVIMPIFGIVSFVLMQFTGVLNPGKMEVPYPVYILVGSTCWAFFLNMIQAGATTLNSGSDFIQQIKYPHEALLFKQVLLQVTNFLISFTLILIAIAALGITPNWKTIFIPLTLIPVFLLGTGIGLLLSVIGVVAVDISRFVNAIMGFLIYTAPIIYSSSVDNPLLQFINKWNPLTYLICTMRDLILFGSMYYPERYMLAAGMSLLVFLSVWKAFFVSEDRIIERMI